MPGLSTPELGRSRISDHFSGVAGAYARYRPHYPAALFDYLATLTTGRELAWDVGAGNGQASVPLAGIFRRVLATDISERQLANAVAHAGVEYRVAVAQDSGLPAASVDLVVVAQAAHWFDLPAFYAEVRRVLAPGGAVVLCTYGMSHLDEPAVESVFQHWSSTVVGPYWPPERRLVDEGYRTLPFPFAERIPPSLELTARWNLRELLGYVDTWSSVSQYREQMQRDPLPALAEALGAVWGPGARTVRWPLAMRVGR